MCCLSRHMHGSPVQGCQYIMTKTRHSICSAKLPANGKWPRLDTSHNIWAAQK